MANEIDNMQQQQPAPSNSNGLGVAGMVVGIIGIVCAFIPGGYWIAFILGILAIVFGAVANSKSKKAGQKNGVAVAGLVLGIITIVMGFISFGACAAIIGGAAVSADSVSQVGTTVAGMLL